MQRKQDEHIENPVDRNNIRTMIMDAICALNEPNDELSVVILNEIYNQMEPHQQEIGEVMQFVVNDPETQPFVMLVQDVLISWENDELVNAAMKMARLFSYMESSALPSFFDMTTLNAIRMNCKAGNQEEVYKSLLGSLYNIVAKMEMKHIGPFIPCFAQDLVFIFDHVVRTDVIKYWPDLVAHILLKYGDCLDDEEEDEEGRKQTFTDIWNKLMILLKEGTSVPPEALRAFGVFIHVDKELVCEVLDNSSVVDIINQNLVSDDKTLRTAYCLRVLESLILEIEDDSLQDLIRDGIANYSPMLNQIMRDETAHAMVRTSFCALCEAFFYVEDAAAVQVFAECDIIETLCLMMHHVEFDAANAALCSLLFGFKLFCDQVIQNLVENKFIDVFVENVETLDEENILYAQHALLRMIEMAKASLLVPTWISIPCEPLVEVFREAGFPVDKEWMELLAIIE